MNSDMSLIDRSLTGQEKAPASRCSLSVSSIPKGLCNSAQGCEERATLGKATDDSQPQRGCGIALFPRSSATTLSGLSPMSRAFSQGSSFLATLGFIAESLWDSALGVIRSNMWVRSRGGSHHSKRWPRASLTLPLLVKETNRP